MALCMLLFGFGLRTSKLADKAFWWDEAWSVYVSAKPLPETTEWVARDAHPPLYQWALHGWVRLVGMSEFANRYFSVLVGVLAIALAGVLARGLSKQRGAGVLAMGLASLSLIHIIWSQETRMYALASLGAVGAFVAYLRLSSMRRVWWGAFVAFSIMATLSHYLGAFAPFALGVHWLFTARWRTKGFNARFIVAGGLIGAVVGAWVLYSLTMATRNPAQVGVDVVYNAYLWFTVLANGQSASIERYETLAFSVLVVLGVGGVWWLIKQWRVGLLMLLVVGLPPFFLAVVGAVLTLPVTDRYFSIYAPIASAVLALALWGVWRMARPVAVLYVMVFVAFGGVFFYERWDARYFQDEYTSLMHAVHHLARPDDHILFVSGERYPYVHYYLDRLNLPNPTPQTVRGVPVAIDLENTMPFLTDRRDALWLINIGLFIGDKDGRASNWLNDNYQTVVNNSVGFDGFAWLAKEGVDAPFPESDAVMPPVITRLRPTDFVRIGVPRGQTVTLWQGQHRVAESTPDHWQLLEYPFYSAYPNGEYVLEVLGERYPVMLSHSQDAPQDTVGNVNASFGALRLIGYQLSERQPRPNSTLNVRLFWEASARSSQEVSVFVHLRGDWNPSTSNPLWAQYDGIPANTPLPAWYEGLVAHDDRPLRIEGLPSGTYTLFVGMYNPQTGQRILLDDGREELLLETFIVP